MADRYYQAYFRTKRGGVGIEYETSRFELLACLGAKLSLRNEWPGRHRVSFDWLGDEAELAKLGSRLGYTVALLRVVSTHVSGRPAEFNMPRRWPVGRIIYKGRDLDLTEVWTADEDARIAQSPHMASFEFATADGADASGPNRNRRLSPLDARLLCNLSGLPDGSLVLDPFAGLGGICDAARARGLRSLAVEIDPELAPGLRARVGAGYAMADARQLPLADACVDGIVTEPPFHRADRAAVIESLPEAARVVRRGGMAVWLVTESMCAQVVADRHWRQEAALCVRRHGIVCSALVWRRL